MSLACVCVCVCVCVCMLVEQSFKYHSINFFMLFWMEQEAICEVEEGKNQSLRVMCWGQITGIGQSLDSDVGIKKSLAICEQKNDMVY